MPSTYTLNNGIELIATGEQSGTWGDTTNTNLSLVDTALDGQVTVTLPSAGTSGSPNTLAISDGAASDGRNRMVIFNDGGDLGATAYVQLTPNDAEKIIYVRNDLAGSRSIILFQGTYNASNDYELPAGTTAVIYFDGAGSGAVAANVFNNAYFDSLRLGSVSVDKILDEDNMASDDASALATQQSIKAYVDSQVTAQDLDFGGDSGTGAVDLDSQTFTIAGTANEIETSASGQTLTIGLPDDVTIAGDLTVDTDTLYVDSTNNRVGIGTTTPAAAIEIITGSDNNSNNGLVIKNPTGGTRLSAYTEENVGVHLQANEGGTARAFMFDVGASEAMRIDSSRNLLVGKTSSSFSTAGHELRAGAAAIFVRDGNDALSLNRLNSDGDIAKFSKDGTAVGSIASNAGAFVFKGTSTSQPVQLQTHDGNEDIELDPDGFIKIETAGVERMRIDSSGRVGIGVTSLSDFESGGDDLVVGDGGGARGMSIYSSATGYGNLYFADPDSSSIGLIRYFHNDNSMRFNTNGSEHMRIVSGGYLLVGKTSAAYGTAGVRIDGGGFTQNTRDGDITAYYNRLTSDGAIVEFAKDGTALGSIGNRATQIYIETPTKTGLDFAGDILPRYNGSLDNGVNVDLGSSGYRFKDLYLSGGVYLGGTGSANFLDDYERGAHSPTGSNAAGDASFTYDGRHGGHYVKVGAMVTYYFRFETDSVTAGTANSTLRISLPFVVSGDDDGSTAGEMGGGPIFYHGNNGTGVAVSAKVGNSFMNVRTSALGDAQMNSDDLDSGFNVLQGVVHFYTES